MKGIEANHIIAVIMIAVGVWFTVYGESLAASSAYYQQKLLKLIHIDAEFSQRTVAGIRFIFVVVGIFFIVMGLLTIFGY